jgi:hypothetical protein
MSSRSSKPSSTNGNETQPPAARPTLQNGRDKAMLAAIQAAQNRADRDAGGMPAKRDPIARPFLSSDMARLKTPPAEGVSTKPNQVFSFDDATTATWQPSDWTTLPPTVQAHAAHVWSTRTWNVPAMERELEGYPDRAFILYLAEHGIRIGDPDRPPPSFDMPNAEHCSTDPQSAAFLRKSLLCEIDASRTWAKPDNLPPSEWIHGLFVKDECKPEQGIFKWRDIHNLASPRGSSINDSIFYASQIWVRHDDVLSRIGKTTLFAKTDLVRMYRMFLVDPADWDKLAFRSIDGIEYWDCAMQWGLRNAVEIAHRFCTWLVHVFNRHGVTNAFGIIDDLLFLDTEEHVAQQAAAGVPDCYETSTSLIDELLGPDARHTKPGKCQPLLPTVIHCGKEYSRAGGRIDPAFGTKLIEQLSRLMKGGKQTYTNDEHGNAIGRCVHAAAVVWAARTYLVPLLAVQGKLAARRGSAPYTTTAPVRRAYRMVHDILEITFGLRLPPGNLTATASMETDARGHASAANEPAAIGIWLDKATYLRLTAPQLRGRFADAPAPKADIAIFEAYAPLVALRAYPERFRGQLIVSLIDNCAAAKVLRTGRGPTHDGPLQGMLQAIAEAIQLELTHLDARFVYVDLVPGAENPRADAVSRGEYHRLP